ncbi:hypothetical protein G6F31_012993 [Rhizopus arrhizus]|nr:hypothetical protein G6F31_012993 [Rhizopus arrhizus]
MPAIVSAIPKPATNCWATARPSAPTTCSALPLHAPPCSRACRPAASPAPPAGSISRWTNRCRRCSAVGAAHEPVVPAGPGGAGHLAAAAADPPRPAPSIRPRQRIRFDDWPLLLVRLLLLAALALLLARPALTGPAPLPAAWTVVAPGLDATALRGTAEEGNWHWLAPGFPAIDHAPPVSSASLPSLLRELDAQLPAGTALTVHVPDPLPGLDGARLQLSRDVQWHTQPMPVTPPQTAVALPRLRVHSEASATAQHWLNALQRAWGVQALPSPLAEDVVPERGEIGVWSRNDALPANWQAWLRDGGLVMRAGKPAASARIVLRDAEGVPLLWQQRIGQGQLLSLPGDWNAASNAALRDPQLPRALLLALQPPTAPRLGDARDQAPHRAALPAHAWQRARRRRALITLLLGLPWALAATVLALRLAGFDVACVVGTVGLLACAAFATARARQLDRQWLQRQLDGSAAPTLARAGHAGAQHAGAATALAAQSIGTVLDRGPRHRAAGTWLAAHERPPRGRCA